MKKDGGVKRWAVICYAVLLLANYQAAAMSFQECYGACFLLCAIIPTNSLFTCTFRCLQDCIIPPSNPLDAAAPTTTTATTQIFYFCELGCALYSCSNLSSRQDPREKEVAGCVGSCSEMCTK